jgi:hypothetical protein
MKTVAAQPVVLKALAKLTFDFAFGKKPDATSLEALIDGIQSGEVDFGHDNPMWRYYELMPAEIKQHRLAGLSEYLPPMDAGANRDIGKYDPMSKVMRFGAKHNDIFPILGDMIRWKLKLSNRHQQRELATA